MIYFIVVYAVEYDEENIEISKRANATLKVLNSLDDTSYDERCAAIVEHSGNKLLAELLKSIDLKSENTLVNFSTNYLDISAKQNYKYFTIINLEILNNVRKINKMFATINQKLPDNGYFICCYESKSTRKKRILNTLPPGLNYIFYSVNYLFRRLLPKVFLTRRLYYDLTNGKKRILSKAEVMGRLYCAGFKILKEKKVGQLFYIYAQREKQPNLDVKKIYGPLIKLKRLGKNGIPFEVYKVRTMHPYSEYLQPYIYETYNLQDGGKFNNDIRINTMGRIMRKYFIDELPMLLNLIKGEMKLVGVRPLSTQYFGLYSEELQQKRLKFKPGLLPPFYADMPHTLNEIQDSEMNYLSQCEQNGVRITDIKYFFKILKSILFNQARSS
jgi:lipopolysaccharide/colanic/teichoic acid biosynthesis glycosyltransferase